MKCAFTPCQEVNHLPLSLNDETKAEKWSFCGWSHLAAWLIERIASVTNVGLAQIAMALQNPTGRKMIVSYLADKFL